VQIKDKWNFPLSPIQSLVFALAIVVMCGSAWGSELPMNGPSWNSKSFLGRFNTIVVGPSTLPSNSDVNPYGVALVPVTSGLLTEGNFLVSNFNNSMNQQGTGTTIVQITPGTDDNGIVTLFAQIDPSLAGCPGGIGLTTALVALRSGFVIVGSLPTIAGDPTTSAAGCLIVLDSNGNVVKTFSGHGINGPWDMTALDFGRFAALFVTNVLNGTVAGTSADVSATPPSPLLVANGGTVVRLLLEIDRHGPELLDSTVIGSGFPERLDPAALVIGPTGVGFDLEHDTLYVADTLNNRVAAIDNALFRFHSDGTGRTVTQNGALNAPLGLVLAPDGHILTVNGGDGSIVETTPGGKQIATDLLDSSGTPPGAGALFGLVAVWNGVYYVDDATNTFNLFH
jgi:DNA-binding beta-propeller fold protein YncE